jgi:hypothetical protein
MPAVVSDDEDSYQGGGGGGGAGGGRVGAPAAATFRDGSDEISPLPLGIPRRIFPPLADFNTSGVDDEEDDNDVGVAASVVAPATDHNYYAEPSRATDTLNHTKQIYKSITLHAQFGTVCKLFNSHTGEFSSGIIQNINAQLAKLSADIQELTSATQTSSQYNTNHSSILCLIKDLLTFLGTSILGVSSEADNPWTDIIQEAIQSTILPCVKTTIDGEDAVFGNIQAVVTKEFNKFKVHNRIRAVKHNIEREQRGEPPVDHEIDEYTLATNILIQFVPPTVGYICDKIKKHKTSSSSSSSSSS